MRKNVLTALLAICSASAAIALPSGLQGLTVGIGAGGLTDGYVQGEYDFVISRYVCLGPELAFGFGGPGAIYGGAAGRYYVIPDLHPVFQPHLAFGLGVAHRFDNDEGKGDGSATGAYITFSFGCDFDIPRSPVSPYVDLGGLFFASNDSDAAFKLEVGTRFAI
jgi:hypothetical protein